MSFPSSMDTIPRADITRGAHHLRSSVWDVSARKASEGVVSRVIVSTMGLMLSPRRMGILVYRTGKDPGVPAMGIKLQPNVHMTVGFSRTVFFGPMILAALSVLTGCSVPVPPGPRVQFPFLAGPEWQGQAEVAGYAGQVTRYGEPRAASLILITVAEPLHSGTLVKAERPSAGVFSGLKQNQVLAYQTGVYPYHQMNSVFWRQSGGGFLRAIMTSQEWCGQTLKQVRPEGDNYRLTWNSYWEDEARGSAVVGVPRHGSPTLVVLYDELPLLVRTPEFRSYRKLHLFPLLMSSQVGRPDWDIGGPRRIPVFVDATAEPQAETVRFEGRDVAALRITIRWSEVGTERKDTFWVDDAGPHRTLLRWRRYDGSELSLVRQSFAPYWKLNRVGDRLP